MKVDNVSVKNNGIQVDGLWYTVDFPATRFLKNVIKGDDVEVKFTEEKDEKGKPHITYVKVTSIQPPLMVSSIDDRMTPIGDLYAMCEEKLNGLIEQNALIQTQLANLTNLTMEIAGKLQIDLVRYKPASEM